MKGTKKLLSIVAVLVLLITNAMGGYAAELSDTSDGIISIDAQAYCEDAGLTLSDLYPEYNTRGTSMPSSTWDCNNGSYSGSFSIQYEYCYTNYYFTGYSQYYVDVIASRDIWTAASDNYTVYLMKGSGQGTIVTSYNVNSTNWQTIRFYNLTPGTKYAVCFAKANDGSNLTGYFYVRNN